MPRATPRSGPKAQRRFQAAGFRIDSDIDFAYLLGPESLVPASLAHGPRRRDPPDVVVSLGEPPADRGLAVRRPRFAFAVLDGRQIVVVVNGADPDAVGRTVLTAGLNAIAYQRGLVPLHASGVAVGEACVAFCGESEAGKSTLAASLAMAGHPALCDDLLIAHPGAGGQPMVWPAERPKLDRRSLSLLGDGAEAVTGFATWDGKAIVRVGADAAPAYRPRRLACLYLLGWGPLGAQRLAPSEALGLLRPCLRSAHWLEPGGAGAQVRQGWLDLVARTPVARLTRPRGASAAELTQALIAAWRRGNLAPPRDGAHRLGAR